MLFLFLSETPDLLSTSSAVVVPFAVNEDMTSWSWAFLEDYKPQIRVSQLLPASGPTREGDLLDLLCHVEGKPEPTDTTWFRVDDEMPPHVTVSGSNLHISSLNKSDNGTYRCEASNEVGKSFVDYMLYVYDPLTTLPPPTTTTIMPTIIIIAELRCHHPFALHSPGAKQPLGWQVLSAQHLSDNLQHNPHRSSMVDGQE
uniref:Uncharacterized protein n=1 Tax=Sphaerodactylus townsendi TaxID=933632 RepID=A0ACB8EZK1_9SAUR